MDNWDENADIMGLIRKLCSDEPSSVTIHHDNPDDGPKCLVECNAAWTGYNDERFTGDSLYSALYEASKVRDLRTTGEAATPELREEPLDRVLNKVRDLLQIMLHSSTPVVSLTDDTISGYSIKTGALHTILSVMQEVGKSVWVPLHVRSEMGRNPPQIPGDPDNQPDQLIRHALNLGDNATLADRALSVYQVSLNAWGSEDGATQDAKLIADHLVAACGPKVG